MSGDSSAWTFHGRGDYLHTTYTLEARTVDLSGNVNMTPVNSTTQTPEDWNPWNDRESQDNIAITTTELQEAINVWLEDLPIPRTAPPAEMTTERLQELIAVWVEGP